MKAVENVGTSTGHVSRKASVKRGWVSREFSINYHSSDFFRVLVLVRSQLVSVFGTI